MENPAQTTRLEGSKLLYDEGGETNTCDATFLISTLLVFIAKGDGSISELETDRMLDILASKLGTGNAEALQHLSTAVMTLADDKDIALKLRQIGKELSPAETENVFEMMLEIAMADEELDSGEAEAVKFAGQILGLSQDRIHSALRALNAR